VEDVMGQMDKLSGTADVRASVSIGAAARALSAVVAVASPSVSVWAADFTGFAAETSVVSSGDVEYSVIDVYAEFAQSSVVVVNAFNASIANAGSAAFRHSDLNTLQSLP
jgi:hypothetical protein